MNVSEAIATRKSVRAFRPDPVPLETVTQILTLAARAPSGGNLQPWKVYVLAGAAREELIRRVAEARKEHPVGEKPEYHIYPAELAEPYRSRRFRVGEAMYGLLGIPREDTLARLAAFSRNWEFFGAPVGMIFTIGRQMQQGQWADLGMFMQNIMLLAREYGLDTCAQEAWAIWPTTLREFLSIPDHEAIYAGMAIGHADWDHPINRFESERVPFEQYVRVVERGL
ncbi:MAG: nitroreductase [Alphaproteobacteria bacterium]|nr:nitroreductase [Alphaproteobacteria bacterium]